MKQRVGFTFDGLGKYPMQRSYDPSEEALKRAQEADPGHVHELFAETIPDKQVGAGNIR
jgi:hypothetical protein